MSSIKKDIRTNQALQVIQHSTEGMSIVEACKEVGIPRSTFYYFTSRNPDAIATFQEMQLIAATQQFALILDNQFEILQDIIQDGLANTTKPRQRIKILKYLDKKIDELSERVGSKNPNISPDFLNGPKLVPGVSNHPRSEKIIPKIDAKDIWDFRQYGTEIREQALLAFHGGIRSPKQQENNPQTIQLQQLAILSRQYR